MTQYKGHIPGSGIQQHSAGELFPVYIEKVGDLWYAVHPEKRWRSIGVSTHASAEVISSIFLDRATSGVDHPQGRQRYEAELKARQNYVPARPRPKVPTLIEIVSVPGADTVRVALHVPGGATVTTRPMTRTQADGVLAALASVRGGVQTQAIYLTNLVLMDMANS